MDLTGIDWAVVGQRAAIILAIWLAIGLLRYLLARWIGSADRLSQKLGLSENDIRRLKLLFDIVLVVAGIALSLYVLQVITLTMVKTYGGRILALAMVWGGVWLLVRYLSVWIERWSEQVEGIDIGRRDLKTLDRMLDLCVILIGLIISLAILQATSLLISALTAAGVFAVAIGFAAKDVASNLISGIFLLIDRPFVIGDAIKIKDFSGTVSQISLRSTEIVTFDGPVVTVPNSTMAVEPTINYTLSQYRRILFKFSVPNTSDINQAIDTLRGVLDTEERSLPDRPPSILVDQIGHNAVDLQVIVYTRSEDLLSTQSDLRSEIVTAFSRDGIELTVPLRVSVTPPGLTSLQPN